jgi:hypothetical protein
MIMTKKTTKKAKTPALDTLQTALGANKVVRETTAKSDESRLLATLQGDDPHAAMEAIAIAPAVFTTFDKPEMLVPPANPRFVKGQEVYYRNESYVFGGYATARFGHIGKYSRKAGGDRELVEGFSVAVGCLQTPIEWAASQPAAAAFKEAVPKAPKEVKPKAPKEPKPKTPRAPAASHDAFPTIDAALKLYKESGIKMTPDLRATLEKYMDAPNPGIKGMRITNKLRFLVKNLKAID